MSRIPPDKRLFIDSYSSPTLEDKDYEGRFIAQLNPESYSTSFQVEYSKKQAPGSSARPMKFSKINPQKFDLEFMVDDTGAVDLPSGGDLGVDARINELKRLTVAYDGKKHRPFYLKVRWGNLLFKCVLESMSINYKLFSPDGVPVRAVVKATFLEFMRNEWMVKKQNDQSPDVTHVRVVKEGDTLPLLAYEIYGDPKYYLAVAQANELFSFRDLYPGQELRFPPIDK